MRKLRISTVLILINLSFIVFCPLTKAQTPPPKYDPAQYLEYFRMYLPPGYPVTLPDSYYEATIGPVMLRPIITNPPIDNKFFFTPEKLFSLKRLSDPKISPDDKWLLYNVAIPDIEKNTSKSELGVIALASKTFNKPKKISGDETVNYNAIWSPLGQKIAYLSVNSGNSNICVRDFPEGRPRIVFSMANGIDNLSWSPDGNYFAFTSEVKIEHSLSDKYPELKLAKARLYDKLPVRRWDRWLDENHSHLFVLKTDNGLPVTGSSSIDLMQGEPYDTPVQPFGGLEQIAWSPDGKEIAYTSKKVSYYALSTNTDIYIVRVDTKQTVNITKDLPGMDMNPLYSPDGEWVAFISLKRPGFESDRHRLMLYNRRTREISELSSSLDQWVGQMIWAPDSKSIYFNAEDKATVQVYQMQVPSGTWKIVTKGRYNYDSGLGITKDGKQLLVGRRDMMHPTEFYLLSITGDRFIGKQLTNENTRLYRDIALVRVEERWVKADDGEKIHCWVLFPPNFVSWGIYPMITYCQGGPQSTISQYFSYRWNLFLMASQGYIVLAPNRRGVPGFGQKWNDEISKDWAGKAMKDILDATDALAEEKYVDKNRLAAVGGSAGGYAVFWLEGNHEKRFKAFIAHCGLFNFESFYGSTEELWFPNWEFGGPYWNEDNEDFYKENSPNRFVNNWDTPIMIVTGEKDFRVPYTQSLEAFTAAQLRKIPSKLLVFPDENHFVLKPQDAILWQKEFFEFLDKYCKNIPPP